ncbi:hypothetical protein BH10PLA1_BH10PLA1_21860 [soil metagenome]
MADQRPPNAPVPPTRTAPPSSAPRPAVHAKPAEPAKPAASAIKTPPVPTKAPAGDEHREQLELAMPSASGAKKITMFGGKDPGKESAPAVVYKRPLNVTGFGASRMKSFIGKISGPGLEYMDTNINLWLDEHPEVEVKQVTSTIGPVDGKAGEHTLVLNIWY